MKLFNFFCILTNFFSTLSDGVALGIQCFDMSSITTDTNVPIMSEERLKAGVRHPDSS